MLIDKLEPSKLERRIVNLETTIQRILALNEKQHEDYKAEIKKRDEDAYGRNQDIATQFYKIMNDHNNRIELVEAKMEEFEELLEEG